jgi:hypothetical protein
VRGRSRAVLTSALRDRSQTGLSHVLGVRRIAEYPTRARELVRAHAFEAFDRDHAALRFASARLANPSRRFGNRGRHASSRRSRALLDARCFDVRLAPTGADHRRIISGSVNGLRAPNASADPRLASRSHQSALAQTLPMARTPEVLVLQPIE